MAIKMVPVAGSSNILAVGYDEGAQTLRVSFHSGGSGDHEGVPKHLYLSFMGAPSYGKFYAQHIKGKFPWTPVLLTERPPGPDISR